MVLASRPAYSVAYRFVVLVAIALFAYSSSCQYRGSASCGYHHSYRNHGSSHACVRADAKVVFENGHMMSIDAVVAGDTVLVEDFAFRVVSNVTCHMGDFVLWEMMPSLPPVTTANHPVKVDGSWYSGDVEAAAASFGIRTTLVGRPSMTHVNKVCSIETVDREIVGVIVVYDDHLFMVAD